MRRNAERTLLRCDGASCCDRNADATHASCKPHQVDKGIQGSAFAARETHKNVGIAKAYLSHISQALDNVDTLVVPIVLQRDGNF